MSLGSKKGVAEKQFSGSCAKVSGCQRKSNQFPERIAIIKCKGLLVSDDTGAIQSFPFLRSIFLRNFLK